MKKLIPFLILLMPSLVWGFGGLMVTQHSPDAAPATYCDTALMCEDFEGNDTCVNLGFTVTATPSCQATTDPIDSYHAELDGATATDKLNYAITSNSTVFFKFSFQASAFSLNRMIAQLNLSGTAALLKVESRSADDKLRIIHGATASSTAGPAMSANTWYTVKVKYSKGTGANGAGYLWVDTGEDVALSTDTGAADASITTGTATNDCNDAQFRGEANGTTDRIDNVYVGTTDPDA